MCTDHAPASGCTEYQQLSRRRFLQWAGGGAAAAAVPAWVPAVRFAESQNSTRDIIISVFQRGGADGLSLVAPFGDAAYYRVRPNIAIPRPDSNLPTRGVALDDRFMLPPAMRSLVAPYRAGDLLFVHAAGQQYTKSRSHFEAERYLEQGKPDDYLIQSGWLARHLALVPPMDPEASLRAVSLTYGMPHTLIGAPRALPIGRPDQFQINTPSELALQRLYGTAWAPLRDKAMDGIATANMLRMLDFDGYRPANGATYGNDNFAQALKSVAVLIKGEVGLEAAHVDIGAWDTHANQGTTGGAMHMIMQELAGGLTAFWQDVMQASQTLRITLVVATEFGRNVRENGSMGTDHGRAGVMFVMGRAIAGGRVLTEWPGIERDQLEDGQDLRVTIDTRDVLAEIVQRRLGNPNLSLIFPDYTPRFRGVTK
jgi:uncharacterized protein (DUF1501 family)